METINTFFIDMPKDVHEAVTVNEDGSYSVFINMKLCQAKRIKAYKHALSHIYGNDFDKTNADYIERIRHEAI